MKQLKKIQRTVIVSLIQESDSIIVTINGVKRGIVADTVHRFSCVCHKLLIHKVLPLKIRNGKCHFVWRVVVNGVRSASMPPSEWLTIIKKHLQHKFHCNVTVAENMQQFSEL